MSYESSRHTGVSSPRIYGGDSDGAERTDCIFIVNEKELPSPRTCWRSLSTAISLLGSTGWFQNLEGAHEGVVNRHHGSCIVKLAAVVGR